jgi:uncharacterized protein involved in outer membrane biogenesis
MNLKRLAIVFAILLMLLVALPLLIPMGTYIARIEQAASGKLGVPVKIESMHFTLLPTPRANLAGLEIGADGEITVGNVAAVLDATTLFDEVRVLSRLEVDEPVFKQSAIALLSSLAGKKRDQAGPVPVALRRLVVNGARLQMEGLNLPALDLDAMIASGGGLQQAVMTSADGKLTINLAPAGTGYTASLSAREWTPPAGPPIVFDTLAANIEYAGTALKFSQVEAQLYRGKLLASGQLDWAKNWQMSGNFNTQGIELGDASRLFTKTIRVTGRIAGTGAFNGTAKEAGKLGDALDLNYRFNVTNGVLYGMDLAKAASLLIRQGQTGGETHFDQFSGTLHKRGGQIELRPLTIVSGLLAAHGHVKVAPDKKLSGRLDTEIKKGVALVTVPLEISGTTDKPVVLPTKAALAGAATGTMLMGPLGTDLGAKTGAVLDKMFGGD